MSIFRKRTKTEKRYSAWKWTHRTLRYGSYPLSAVPLAVYSGVNWNNWLQQTNSFSLGWGFGTAILGIVLTIFGLTTFDEIISKKISRLVTFGVVLAVFGASFVLLAELYRVLGYMLLYVGAGFGGAGIATTVDKTIITKGLARYDKILGKTNLNSEHKKEEKITQQAIKDGIIKEDLDTYE